MYPLMAIPALATVPAIPMNHSSSKIKKIPATDPIIPIVKPSFDASFLFFYIRYL
jgi:hypothetical protein